MAQVRPVLGPKQEQIGTKREAEQTRQPVRNTGGDLRVLQDADHDGQQTEDAAGGLLSDREAVFEWDVGILQGADFPLLRMTSGGCEKQRNSSGIASLRQAQDMPHSKGTA